MRRSQGLAVLVALLTMLVLAGACQADAVSYKFPFTTTLDVPCANGGAGEVVAFTGIWHSLVSSSLDRDGKLHIVWQDKASGQAVGTVSGDEFNFSQRWVWNYQQYGGFDAKVWQDTLTLRLVGKDDAPDLRARLWVKHTYNANGEMTTEILRAEPLCP